MIKKSSKIKCDLCGRFISCEDLRNEKAIHRMSLPDSDYSRETWESICEKCKKRENNE